MKKLSIIIPTFNEEKTIFQILKRINETKSSLINYEIIVVNDGSTDDSYNILKNNSSFYDKIINCKKNLGKGNAVKEGLKKATGDYIVFQDADLEYDPKDLQKFITIINLFNPDLVLGSRFNYDLYTRSHNFFNKIGNKFLSNFFNFFYNTTFTDIYNCYLCFKKDLILADDLKTKGFEQHAEILCKLVKKGNLFYEVGINYNGRNFDEGKKIRYYHIFPVIFEIIKQKFIN